MTGEADSGVRLRGWLGSGKPYQQIAAEIAAWAAGKERGTVLPDDSEFGRDLDVMVGPSTYGRAKRFLVTQGVLSTDDAPTRSRYARIAEIIGVSQATPCRHLDTTFEHRVILAP
jgi:hypothetical protein